MERRGRSRRSYHTQEETDHPIEVTNTSNHVGPFGSGNRVLEAYVTVNGVKVKALLDTGTMGDNLISRKFVSAFQIPTQDLDTPISLKMAVKGSRSTINYKLQPLIQVGDETGDTVREPEKGSEALGNEKREKLWSCFFSALPLLSVPTTCLYIHDTRDHHHRSLYPHYAI